MFAEFMMRSLAIVGFTLLPLFLVNLWAHEEKVPSWMRAWASVIVGSLALALNIGLFA
jgi:hypothetical protein